MATREPFTDEVLWLCPEPERDRAPRMVAVVSPESHTLNVIIRHDVDGARVTGEITLSQADALALVEFLSRAV